MPGWRFSVPYLPLLAVVVVLGWFRLLPEGAVRRPALLSTGALAVVAISTLLLVGVSTCLLVRKAMYFPFGLMRCRCRESPAGNLGSSWRVTSWSKIFLKSEPPRWKV